MRLSIQFILFLCLLSGPLAAQLSPGDLSNAHKDLEGVANCTKCHDIGNKVSNNKCLSCHQPIKSQVDAGRGFHTSSEVRGKDCAKCHNDHHGRRFDMVRFDEKNFNHNLTGYDLTGAHKQIDCRKCHKSDFIEDQNLRKKQETFLGLRQNCNACHKDYHQKTLGNDCAKCHTTDDFKPASKFNHDKTDFALVGKHKAVQCIECHQKELRNGENFQRFDGVAFKNCSSCHKDPHQNHLGNNCKECHNEQGFEALSGLSKFNHSKTDFALKGKHKHVDCRECHQMQSATPINVFQDRLGVANQDCKACHKDVHDGRFGLDCAACHTEESFKKLQNPGKFDHNLTEFPLRGKHEVVDCRKCHISENMTDALPHNSCASCHKDYHEGQFTRPPKPAEDCANCHTVEGFAGSTFSIELHTLTNFPLDGAHVATPCLACHKKEEKWSFRNIGTKCADCHQDVHQNQIDTKWYPDKSCNNCHQTSAWTDNHFDHKKTAFALKGAHLQTACRECHKPDETYPHGKFAGLASTCASCHNDQHNNQFALKGVTDCARCHTFDNWEISNFDHNKTRFKLDGKHEQVACTGCHKVIGSGSTAYVQYKFESTDCATCHR